MSVLNDTGIRAGASGAGGGGDYQIEKSLRFNGDDTAHLVKATSAAGDQKTFTVSFWMKKCKLGNVYQYIYTTEYASGSYYFQITSNSDQLQVYNTHASANVNVKLNNVFRDPAAWYHIVLKVDTAQSGDESNRLKFYVNGVHETDYADHDFPAQDYTFAMLANKDRLIGSADFSGSISANCFDGYLADFHYIDGTALDADSFGETNEDTGQWVPKEYTGGSYGTNGFYLKFNGTDLGEDSSGNDNHWTANNLSTLVGNGNHASEVSGTPYSTSYAITNMFNGLTNMYIAASSGSTTWTPVGGLSFTKLRAYLYQASGTGGITFNWSGGSYALSFTNATADYDWIDVTSNVTSPVTSIQWNTSGTTGPYVGKWEVNDVELIDNSFSAGCDVSTDTPTPFDDGGNGTGNYCTWNPLTLRNGGGTMELVDGNLNFGDQGTASRYGCITGTMAVASGKWYFEVTYGSGTGVDTNVYVGILPIEQYQNNDSANAFNANSAALSLRGDKAYRGDNSSTDSYASGIAIGDTVGIAFDVDAGTSTWYLNGTSLGAFPYALASGYTWTPFATDWSSGQPISEFIINCGQRAFAYTNAGVDRPAADYLALNTYNLLDPTIVDPSEHFETVLWEPDASEADTAIITTTAYRYHRILCEGAGGGGAISEIQFYDSSGLIDASDTNNAGSTVASNENKSGAGSLAAWTAFDGTLGGADHTQGVRKDGSVGFYISKDWGSGNSKTITSVKIWGVNNYGIAGNDADKYVKLQGSNDNSNWTDLQTWNSGRYGTWTTSSSTSPAHTSVQNMGILAAANAVTDGADFVWIKDRDNSDDHILFNRINDSGMDGTPHLRSNETDTEATCGTYSAPSGNSVAWVWNAGDAVNPTSVSAGDFNSTAYDQSQTWSSSLTASSGLSNATNAFDGSVSTRAESSAGTNQTLTFAPSSDVSFTSTLEVYCDQGDATPTASWNGNSVNPGSGAWVTVFTGAGTINTTYPLVINTQGAAQYATLKGVRVDGKILVDSGVTINSPSIASSYRANPTAGFSIVSYTGNGGNTSKTVAHGLNTTPDFLLVKARDATTGWMVHHSSKPGKIFYLHNDSAEQSSTAFSTPNSSTITVGDTWTNNTGDLYIAHVWSEVEGYSKFGSYEGTRLGSPNGVFVYCGFKPAWILVKNTEDAEDWYMWDNKRDGYNPTYQFLEAHDTDAENSTTNDGTIDIVSNGFKLRVQYAPNQDKTYIFAAFAESPFKHSNAR